MRPPHCPRVAKGLLFLFFLLQRSQGRRLHPPHPREVRCEGGSHLERSPDTHHREEEPPVSQRHFFMDEYRGEKSPGVLEWGHLAEGPSTWETVFQRKEGDRHLGQARWGDAKGGFSEHYWDFNNPSLIDDL